MPGCMYFLLDCTSVADVCFVIDSSGSINEVQDNYSVLKRFINNVIDRLNIGINDVHVGAVKFSDSANVEFPLNRHYTATAAKNAINTMSYIGGFTNTQRGLEVSCNLRLLFL